jgi:oligopeptidase B
MTLLPRIFGVALACAALPLMAQTMDPKAATPPSAAKKPKVMTKFGDRRVDDYFWLRDKADPAVIDYLKAENAYAEAVMKPLEGFREKLYKEMLARIKETDESVPYRNKGWWYYQREVEGKQYPIHCRRKGSMEAPEEVILDVNALAEGKKFTAVGIMEVSPDGTKLAYSVDYTGFRTYTLQVKDLATGALGPEKIERVTSLAWAADNKTVFYVEEHPETKRSYRLHRKVLGEPGADLLHEEKDEAFDIVVGETRSEKFVVMAALSKDTTEMRVLPAAEPRGEFRIIEKRRKNHEYFVSHHEDEFFIRTNDKGRNFRLVRAPVATPGSKHWKQVIAPRKLVMLEDIDVFRDFWVAVERVNGLLKLRVTDFKSGEHHYIDVPEAVYSTSAGTNAEYDTDTFRFVYESLVTPRSWYDYEVAKRTRKLLKQQPVLGGYDPSLYASEALVATAKDGTKIPMSMVYRKSMRSGQPQPLLLYGYGSYGISMDPWFRSTRVSLLDRGVVFVIAHVRGGGDRGRTWYDDGKLMKKKNTFTDFVACAEHLVARGYTAPDRLVIQGGSAGGLLMGAVTNLRPDLFKAVVTQVPFVDVMSTMLDTTLPLTTQEYVEWGNPNQERAYRYMRSYSPYDNLKKGAYPAMLVETSLNDSLVMFWEPAKYVARLRTLKTDSNPLLLKTILEAGHGGASGRYDALRELAFTYAFVLDQFGLAK